MSVGIRALAACSVAAWLFIVGMAIAVAAGPQLSFRSAEEAAGMLAQAVKARDTKTLVAILGPGSGEWISSGDTVADRAAAERFVAAFEEKHAIAPSGASGATLLIGAGDWPFAFPLVRSSAGWHFDTQAGKRELLRRRIGENELATINVMLALVDAQREYASRVRDASGVPQYARKFAATPGTQDGLYWPTSSDEPQSPLGALVVRAAREGYALKKEKIDASPRPYHGYYFRLLTAQGPHAAGGAMSYVVKGRMIGGFAAVAYPAQYANSGVMTFIVNQDGIVHQKDLGPETAAKARALTRFDPGPGWSMVSQK